MIRKLFLFFVIMPLYVHAQNSRLNIIDEIYFFLSEFNQSELCEIENGYAIEKIEIDKNRNRKNTVYQFNNNNLIQKFSSNCNGLAYFYAASYDDSSYHSILKNNNLKTIRSITAKFEKNNLTQIFHQIDGSSMIDTINFLYDNNLQLIKIVFKNYFDSLVYNDNRISSIMRHDSSGTKIIYEIKYESSNSKIIINEFSNYPKINRQSIFTIDSNGFILEKEIIKYSNNSTNHLTEFFVSYSYEKNKIIRNSISFGKDRYKDIYLFNDKNQLIEHLGYHKNRIIYHSFFFYL